MRGEDCAPTGRRRQAPWVAAFQQFADVLQGRRRTIADQDHREMVRLTVAGFDLCLIGQRNDHGFHAEDFLRHLRQPRDDPALAIVVVHHEQAARFHLRAHVRERFLREEKTLQPQARIAGVQHERIHQRVEREIVLARRVAHEAAAVVEIAGDVRGVVVGPVGMILRADAADARVDLHGVDVLHAGRQRGGHVVARTRADDEHVAHRRLPDALRSSCGSTYAPWKVRISCMSWCARLLTLIARVRGS